MDKTPEELLEDIHKAVVPPKQLSSLEQIADNTAGTHAAVSRGNDTLIGVRENLNYIRISSSGTSKFTEKMSDKSTAMLSASVAEYVITGARSLIESGIA